jgi:hypothetical protein
VGGLVGVIANDSARYSLFSSCIDQLDLPDGWTKEWVIGGDWCDARNQLCQLVLDKGYSHLWFMDDDHAFPPQILTKLLAHDVPLVTPVCLTRTYPFNPVQYVEIGDEVGADGNEKRLPLPLSQVGTEGLVRVSVAGCAGMLISNEVIANTKMLSLSTSEGYAFRNMNPDEPPRWFEYSDRSEDIIFCEKAKVAGYSVHTDLSVRLGHITTAVVWPAVENGRWVTGFNIGRDLNVNVETFEGFLAQEKPWVWKLTPESDQEIVLIRLERGASEPVNWQPPIGRVPEGVLQWWVDENDGNGFHPVGDPFTYTLEEA